MCRNNSQLHDKKIKNIFAGKVAAGWDTKGELISEMKGSDNIAYKWIEENMTEGMRLLDVGCATGRLIQRMDKCIKKSYFYGIDISSDMTAKAHLKLENTRNNYVEIINDEFMEHDFGNDKFDILVFKFVLHHMRDEELALLKAKDLLNLGGKLVIYTPGSLHFGELFEFDNECKNDFLGRKSKKQLGMLLQRTNMEIDSINECNFEMRFRNFNNLMDFLRRTGTYQKIIGYEDKEWDSLFADGIKAKYKDKMWNKGEFLLAAYTKS